MLFQIVLYIDVGRRLHCKGMRDSRIARIQSNVANVDERGLDADALTIESHLVWLKFRALNGFLALGHSLALVRIAAAGLGKFCNVFDLDLKTLEQLPTCRVLEVIELRRARVL